MGPKEKNVAMAEKLKLWECKSEVLLYSKKEREMPTTISISFSLMKCTNKHNEECSSFKQISKHFTKKRVKR
jgi:hypothetical protein